MMRALRHIVRFLDALAEGTGRVTAVFAPLMVLVTCFIVVQRYGFNAGSVAVQELVVYCNALLFLCGAAYTLKHDAHVRVDVLYGTANPRTRAWINLLGTLLLLFPSMIFIFVYCQNYVAAAWAIRERSADTGGLAFVYLLKTLMLVMAVLVSLQGLSELLRNVLFLACPGSPTDPSAHAAEDGAI